LEVKNPTDKETSMSKYSVELTAEERAYCEEIIKKGVGLASEIRHAHLLLKMDKGKDGPRWTDKELMEVFGVGETQPRWVRKRYKAEGVEAAIKKRPHPKRPEKKKITGEQEAHIIAVLCTEQPEGAERWTLRALTDRILELEIVEETVSYETVRQVLKKMSLNPGKRSRGV
jgi:transposase